MLVKAFLTRLKIEYFFFTTQINKKVENIEINDIPEIKVEDTIEPVYDNPDIIENPAKENDELYKKLIKLND